ncbi:MAG TPA: enoyl-CoA hydratase [Candidatus Binataceae bacterium]|nr:enoyl-CoA hydratase [Candidatus Binataceae bacterium]
MEVSAHSAARAYAGGKMLAARQGAVGTITFNQPEKHNAVSVEMWQGLAEILTEFQADPALRVVILTGAGERAFVSGADISQFEQQRADAEAQRQYDRLTGIGRTALAAFSKPVIARIRGFCLGGGLAIAMQADLRIASADSRLGIPAARLGLAYSLEAIARLISLVGPAHARMLLYSGRRIDAAEAARIGLINQVVPTEELSQVVDDLAATIAENAPLSVAASKLCVEQLTREPSARDDGAIQRAIEACFNSADYREGRLAFKEKRAPRFQGR